MILCMIFFFCFFLALCHRELAENGLPMIRQTEIEHRIVDMCTQYYSKTSGPPTQRFC